MSGQRRQRERWQRGGEGAEEHKFNAATTLAEEKTETGRERGRNGKEVCDAAQTDWPLRNSRGGQEASGSRAVQCGVQSGPESYITELRHAVTQIPGEIRHSARVRGGQSRSRI